MSHKRNDGSVLRKGREQLGQIPLIGYVEWGQVIDHWVWSHGGHCDFEESCFCGVVDMKAIGVNSGKNGRRRGGDMAVVDPFFFFFWYFLEVVLQREMKKWWRNWRALWVWRKTFVVFITVVFNGRCYTMSLRWLVGKKAAWGNRDQSQLQEFYLWEEREWDPVYKGGRGAGVVLALGAKGSLLHLTRGKSAGEVADLVGELVEALFRVLLFSRWNKK